MSVDGKIAGASLGEPTQQSSTAKRESASPASTGIITDTACYVNILAEQQGVIYRSTFCDFWASAVTRLAGDEIMPDATDDLLVALTRNGSLCPDELVRLVIKHHRELKKEV